MTVQSDCQGRGGEDRTWHGCLTGFTMSEWQDTQPPCGFPFCIYSMWAQMALLPYLAPTLRKPWNSLTHWFDLLVFEWPFMVHTESVCCHWLCIVREKWTLDCSWDDGIAQPMDVAFLMKITILFLQFYILLIVWMCVHTFTVLFSNWDTNICCF